MARNVYGLDLGTYEIKVFDYKNTKIWKEKNVIAIKQEEIFAIGDEAYQMFEKSPPSIQVVFPMQSGAIVRFNYMQHLLVNLLNSKESMMKGAEYLIAVPTDVTEVEKRALYDLVLHSALKPKTVRMVERGIVDTIGCGVNVWDTKGVFVANIGSGTTELSILASGGIVLSRLLKIGGESLDLAIINAVRQYHDLIIGPLTAGMLRRQFGIFEQETDKTVTASGRHLVSGLPVAKQIPIGLIRTAMKELLDEWVQAIQAMVGRTPPDVHQAILANGMHLTGGVGNMHGFSTYLKERTGLPVMVTESPELCTMTGLQTMISNQKEYKNLTYSMLGEDYRWLR